MNIKPGSMYVVSPKNEWNGKIHENCMVYMLAFTPTGRYRVIWIKIPAGMLITKEWEKFIAVTKFAFFKNKTQIVEGYTSLYAMRRKEYCDIRLELNTEYTHVPTSNIVLAVRNASLK